MSKDQNKSIVSGFIAAIIFFLVVIVLLIIGFLTPWIPNL